MQEYFDPYVEWLGFPPGQPPGDYYVLFGLPVCENDQGRIAQAVDRLRSKVRGIRPGQHVAEWQFLLDQITTGRDCLTNPEMKSQYDATLRPAMPAAPAWPVPPATGVASFSYASPTMATPPVATPPLATPPTVTTPAATLPPSEPPAATPPVGFSPTAPPVFPAGGAPALGTASALPVWMQADLAKNMAWSPPSAAAPVAAAPVAAAPSVSPPPLPGASIPAPVGAPLALPAAQATPLVPVAQAVPAPQATPVVPMGVAVPAPAFPTDLAQTVQNQTRSTSRRSGNKSVLVAMTPGSAIAFGVFLLAAGGVGTHLFMRSVKAPPVEEAQVVHRAPADPQDTVPPTPPKEKTVAVKPRAAVVPGKPVDDEPNGMPADWSRKPETLKPSVKPAAAKPATEKPPTGKSPVEVAMAEKPAAEKPAAGTPNGAAPAGETDPAKQAALRKALATAKTAMAERNMEDALKELKQARANVQSSADNDEVSRAEGMYGNLKEFWRLMRMRVSRLQPTEELAVGNTRIAVVEADADNLAVKAEGRIQRFRTEFMPTWLAIAIAESSFAKDPASKAILGTFHAVDPQGDRARAKALFAEAAKGGINVKEMVADNADVPDASGKKDSESVEDPAKLQAAEQAVKQRFEKDFADATTPIKKESFAKKLMAAAGQAKNEPYLQKAALRAAVEQATAAGKVETAAEALDRMNTLFHTDVLEQKIAMLEEAMRTGKGPSVPREVAAVAAKTIDKAVNAGQRAEAFRLAQIGLEAARKSQSVPLVQKFNLLMRQLGAAMDKQ